MQKIWNFLFNAENRSFSSVYPFPFPDLWRISHGTGNMCWDSVSIMLNYVHGIRTKNYKFLCDICRLIGKWLRHCITYKSAEESQQLSSANHSLRKILREKQKVLRENHQLREHIFGWRQKLPQFWQGGRGQQTRNKLFQEVWYRLHVTSC
jgi:hypothetical protein